MNVYLATAAQKAYDKTNEPDTSRLKKAFLELSKEPPQGDITRLEGHKGRYRVRVGGWRILFRIDSDYVDPETKEKGAVIVFEIDIRGDVYKGV